LVTCSDCGSDIEKIPAWLMGVKIRFVCDNCRQKHPKPLLLMDSDLETTAKPAGEGDSDEPEIISLEEVDLEGESEEPNFDEDPDAI